MKKPHGLYLIAPIFLIYVSCQRIQDLIIKMVSRYTLFLKESESFHSANHNVWWEVKTRTPKQWSSKHLVLRSQSCLEITSKHETNTYDLSV